MNWVADAPFLLPWPIPAWAAPTASREVVASAEEEAEVAEDAEVATRALEAGALELLISSARLMVRPAHITYVDSADAEVEDAELADVEGRR